jgi:hypothetical protein
MKGTIRNENGVFYFTSEDNLLDIILTTDLDYYASSAILSNNINFRFKQENYINFNFKFDIEGRIGHLFLDKEMIDMQFGKKMEFFLEFVSGIYHMRDIIPKFPVRIYNMFKDDEIFSKPGYSISRQEYHEHCHHSSANYTSSKDIKLCHSLQNLNIFFLLGDIIIPSLSTGPLQDWVNDYLKSETTEHIMSYMFGMCDEYVDDCKDFLLEFFDKTYEVKNSALMLTNYMTDVDFFESIVSRVKVLDLKEPFLILTFEDDPSIQLKTLSLAGEDEFARTLFDGKYLS